ncbi:MAG: bifunctional hydroxymethylpyrimidine kinase/phosphomethylpyrimidine kinase, partial [Candidatus Aureabacteria bacterium]|nr:bifunctional hydroxymethylpyrimidine kinase/phosphomethylpyrimidine kinase [Candidatus Auribacterota bacterium]
GSGCILAAAIAAGLAKGMGAMESIRAARAYVASQARAALPLGPGVSVALHRRGAAGAAVGPRS